MKKYIYMTGMMLTMAVSAAPANAESGGLVFEPYGMVGVGTLSIKQTGLRQITATTFSQMGKAYYPYAYAVIGANVHKYLAVEMRYGATKADANNATSVNTKATADYLFSILVKPQAYMTDDAIIYALLGGTRARIAGPGVGSPANNNSIGTKVSTGFSYGVGAEYKLNDHMSGAFEAIRYMKTNATPPTPNKVTLDSYSFNLKYYF
ncbi:outer membrane beta-barrel protein [Mariprofundus ferrooxydans]|uniref:outer membrane beta-barrel protein n=1 Tax=Mariprofundus ferrooxydans TaxID=314344 RepID=UPI0014313BB2|nr:outer membrane beta-barrel protein [Mariprofundus ferrooxydans]